MPRRKVMDPHSWPRLLPTAVCWWMLLLLWTTPTKGILSRWQSLSSTARCYTSSFVLQNGRSSSGWTYTTLTWGILLLWGLVLYDFMSVLYDTRWWIPEYQGGRFSSQHQGTHNKNLSNYYSRNLKPLWPFKKLSSSFIIYISQVGI